ncbi:MAG: hypothetical protein ACI83D_000775, partial [Planctomycetota bacterium]
RGISMYWSLSLLNTLGLPQGHFHVLVVITPQYIRSFYAGCFEERFSCDYSATTS